MLIRDLATSAAADDWVGQSWSPASRAPVARQRGVSCWSAGRPFLLSSHRRVQPIAGHLSLDRFISAMPPLLPEWVTPMVATLNAAIAAPITAFMLSLLVSPTIVPYHLRRTVL